MKSVHALMLARNNAILHIPNVTTLSNVNTFPLLSIQLRLEQPWYFRQLR